MLRVLQIAVGLFVLSLILTLQQCSGENEVVQKQSVVEENDIPSVVSDGEKEIVKTTNKESHSKEKKEENLTTVSLEESNVSTIPKNHYSIVTKNAPLTTQEENESTVVQYLIAEMIKRNAQEPQKEMQKESSLKHTKHEEENKSDVIQVYFRASEPNPLENELIALKEKQQIQGQKAYVQSIHLKKILTHNQALKERISELLMLSKNVREKSKTKEIQVQTLLSTKESLDNNLTQEQHKVKVLLSKIEVLKKKYTQKLNAEMLQTKNMLSKVRQREQNRSTQMKTLFAGIKSLENNLTQVEEAKNKVLDENKALKEKQQTQGQKAYEQSVQLKKVLTHNQALKERIAELLLLSKNIREKSEDKEMQVQSLLSIKENLDNNFTEEQHKVKVLLSLQKSLENNLTQVEESKNKVLDENKALKEKQQIQGQKAYEQSIQLKKVLTHNQVLKDRIAELLLLSKNIREKSEDKEMQVQSLLSIKENLDSNFTKEQHKVKVLLSLQKSLESNMTQVEETKNKFLDENKALKERLSHLSTKANEEINASQIKYAALMQKENQEHIAVQKLLSIKESLENNLTKEQEKEQVLLTDNQALKEKIEQLEAEPKVVNELNVTKVALTKLQNKYDKTTMALKKLLSDKQDLEGNVVQVGEDYQKLVQENTLLQDAFKKTQGMVEKFQALKQELNITKAAYVDSLTKEKKSQEILQNKGQVCASKLSEIMLAIAALKEEKNTQMQGLLSGKESAEEAFLQLKKERELLFQENETLKQRMKEEQDTHSQMLAKVHSQLEETQEKMQIIETKNEEQITIQKEKKELFEQFKLAKVAFKNNSAELTSDSKKRLNSVAMIMNKYKNFHYKIQGHTDSMGNPRYNLKLSQIRAQKVEKYLVSQGVDSDILSAKGYGSSVPISSNKTRKSRLKNRRVVFEIIQP